VSREAADAACFKMSVSGVIGRPSVWSNYFPVGNFSLAWAIRWLNFGWR
jgi:hypothetical protein